MKTLPWLLLFIILLSGCRQLAVRSLIDESASIMDSLPDSALKILQNINPDEISGERLKADYALFMSQALYKNFIDVNDDSLISIASDYYCEKQPSRNKMLACFYDGIIKHRLGNHSGGIVAALDAEEIALSLGDYYYLGMIYELLAQAYCDVYGNDDELQYAILALENYCKAGKNDHADFAALNLGNAYNNVGNYVRGLEMFDSIRFSSCEDADVINDAMRRSLTSLMGLKNYLEIIRRCSNSDSIADALEDARILAYLSLAYYHIGNKSKSEFYKRESLKRLTSEEAVTVYGIFYNMACYDKNAEAMALYDDKIEKMRDSIQTIILNQQLNKVHQDYYRQKSKSIAVRAERDRNRIILIGIFSFCSILIVVVLLYNRNKKRRIEFENILVSIQNERDALMRDNSDATLYIDELLRHKFDTVQSLCDSYFEQSGNNKNKEIIYKDVAKIIESFSSEETMETLETALNKYKNNIIKRLRKQVNLSPTEIRLVIYFMSGFSARSICCFTQTMPSNLYNQKSRLKKKIAASVLSDAHEFLNAIG